MTVAVIESLDHEGRGVAHTDGKVVFIDGALPGETVEYNVYRQRSGYDQAHAVRIIRPGAQRVTPRCPHFGKCGGCSMQHLDAAAQSAVKQRVLEDALWHIGKVRPGIIYPVIQGAAWGYRHRARIGVRVVPGKGGVLIGFRERRSSYISDMHRCDILPERISSLLPELHGLIGQLSIADRIPQIELAIGEGAATLVFRHLLPLSQRDKQLLTAFAIEKHIHIGLQAGGPETVQPLYPENACDLVYRLPEYDIALNFRPTDFTQVNVPINRLLVRRAMHLLAPQAGERIADLFCGLGNFSLPIARMGAYVVGIEGSDTLVRRAAHNAWRNGLESHSEFHAANLFETTEDSLAALGHCDKMLIDPPREGAIAVIKALGARQRPRIIVYVSCNPATLARDAAVLTHEKGYTLRGAGIANMFPHTSHVETVALFEYTA